jgi:hypothetical protein
MIHYFQNAVALVVVAVAAGYLSISLGRWLRRRGTTGCGGACGGCQSNEPVTSQQRLVSLEMSPPAQKNSP